MKKAYSWGLVFLLAVSMALLPVQAVSNEQKSEVIHTEFGDLEVETTTVIRNTLSRSSSVSVNRTKTIKNSGKVIAEVTLSVTYGYDGKTAWVTSASGSHETYEGWSYSGEKITKSGGTATLSAKLTHSRYENVPVNISLTCSPTGQII